MIRNSTNDLSIKPKMSRSIFMTVVISGAFALFALMYFVYEYGVRSGHEKFEQDQELISQFNNTIESLRANLNIAEDGLVISKRQQQIQEEAYKQMSRAYANSEQKNSVLGSRLDFYRSIISPEDGQSGPAIQSVEMQFVAGKLNFDITLVQAIKHKHQVRGSLRASLYDGDTPLSQWPLSSDRSVSYQYFQQISGSIEVPELAASARLKIELVLQDGSTMERWFNVSSNS
jgi:hypothetical protein